MSTGKPGKGLPLRIRPLEPGDWPIIVRLFGANGACGGCWCTWARIIEGYPAVPHNSSEPLPAAFAWTGVPALFEKAGYSPLVQPKASRTVFVKHGRKR